MAELWRAQHDNQPYQILIMDSGSTDAKGVDLERSIQADSTLIPPHVLLLDRYGSSMPGGSSGLRRYLGKPLRLDRMMEAIHSLLTNSPSESVASEVPAPENFTPTAKSYRILVVEDNRTNQMVAAGMLSMNGCHCEFAGNGREAVEAVQKDRFDLILMDCSMPEMDGYEATAEIRKIEATTGQHTPIVAMTANTQQGDLEKCLDAGMDDYLAKPITLADLRRKQERWLGQVSVSQAPAPAGSPADNSSPLDREVFDKLREILGSTLQQAVVPFLEDTPAYLVQLEQAIMELDAEKARAAAHSIKGSSGNLGAVDVSQLSKQAEDFALDGRLTDIR